MIHFLHKRARAKYLFNSGSYRQLIFVSALSFAIVALAPLSYSADQDFFTVYDLTVEGKILGRLTGDFNGDGLADVGVIYYPSQNADDRRYVALFLQSSSVGFTRIPTNLLQIPNSLAMAQAVDLDGDGTCEIVGVDDGGAQVIRFAKGRGFQPPARLASHQTLFQTSRFFGALIGNVAFDINSQPGAELAIPTSAGLTLLGANARGAYGVIAELNAGSGGSHSGEHANFFDRRSVRGYVVEPPRIVVADVNADLRKDVFVLQSDRVALFLQDAGGAFPQAPDRVTRFLVPASVEMCQTQLADLNADGRLDAVALRTSGGVGAAEARLDVYLGESTGLIATIPSKTISISETRCHLLLSDVTGDRIPEIILPAVEVGSLATVKMLMQQKGSVHLLVYPLKAGLPSEKTMQKIKLDFSLDLANTEADNEVAICSGGDYNGDGREDIAFSDGAGKVKFYLGSLNGFVAPSATVEVGTPDAIEMTTSDLNNDKRSDLVIERASGGKTSHLSVLVTRRQ